MNDFKFDFDSTGLTAGDLADLTGTPIGTVRSWLAGVRKPSADAVKCVDAIIGDMRRTALAILEAIDQAAEEHGVPNVVEIAIPSDGDPDKRFPAGCYRRLAEALNLYAPVNTVARGTTGAVSAALESRRRAELGEF